jgi:outer membrane protein TolC
MKESKNQCVFNAVVCSCLLIMSGCAVIPSLQAEQKGLLKGSAEFVHQGVNEATQYPSAILGQYIDQAPVTLMIHGEVNTLLAKTVEHNLQIIAAKTNVAKAMANKQLADAGDRLTLEANISAERERKSNSVPGQASVNQSTTSVSVDLTIPIDLFGKLALLKTSAGYVVQQANEQLTDKVNNVLSQLTITAINAAQTSQLLKLIEKQLRASQTAEKLTQIRYKNGQVNLLAVLQQKDFVLSLQQELSQLKAQRLNQLDQLSVISGALPGSLAANTFIALPELISSAHIVSPKALLHTRADLNALKAGVDAANSQLSAAIKDRLPSFDFSSRKLLKLLSGDLSSLVTGTLSAALTLIDGQQKTAAIAQRTATLESNGASYIQAWLNAVTDVAALLAKQQRFDDELVLAQQRLDNSKKMHLAALERYNFGSSDYLSVLDAKRTLVQLERSLLTLQGSVLRTKIELHLAMGGKMPTTG